MREPGEFQIEFRSNRIFKEKKLGSDKRAANCLKAFAGVADEAMVQIKHKFQLASPNRLKAWTDKPGELSFELCWCSSGKFAAEAISLGFLLLFYFHFGLGFVGAEKRF